MPFDGGETLKDRAMSVIRTMGIATLKEFMKEGIHSVILRRLLAEGYVANPARGVYVLPEHMDDPDIAYAVEAISAPSNGMMCLLTAAHFHGLIARDPKTLWIAVPRGGWSPVSTGLLPVKCLKCWDLDFDGTLEWPDDIFEPQTEIVLAGRSFKMTSPARTVVDIFVHRKFFGLDVAIEAMGAALDKGTTICEIEAFAALQGEGEAIAPYLCGAGASLNRRY